MFKLMNSKLLIRYAANCTLPTIFQSTLISFHIDFLLSWKSLIFIHYVQYEKELAKLAGVFSLIYCYDIVTLFSRGKTFLRRDCSAVRKLSKGRI